MSNIKIQTQRVNGSWQTVQVISNEVTKLAIYLKAALRLSQASPKKARAIDSNGQIVDFISE